MKNIDKLRKLSPDKLAQCIVFDEEGNMQAPCGVCAAQGNCHDDCYRGVKEWLEAEVKEKKA